MSIDIENNNSFNAFYFLNDYISNSITDFIKSTPHNVVSVFNGNLSPEMIITFLSYFGQMSNHLYIISLMQHMGCPVRLRHNVAIDGFCLVISANFYHLYLHHKTLHLFISQLWGEPASGSDVMVHAQRIVTNCSMVVHVR